MLSSLKDDNIVKGIPTYILAISIVTPLIMFSGALAETGIAGTGSDSGIDTGGRLDFLERNWRSWSDEEWDIFLELVLIYDEVVDESMLPPELRDFVIKMENMSEDELGEFSLELMDRFDEYGEDFY